MLEHFCCGFRWRVPVKGKSGGSRVITNVVVANDTVYLLTIYDKSDKDNLTDKELKELLNLVPD